MESSPTFTAVFESKCDNVIEIPFTLDEYMAEINKAESGPDYVLVASMAKAFKMDKHNMNKKLRLWGFEFIRVRTIETNGQLTNALSPADAKRACDRFIQEGYGYR